MSKSPTICKYTVNKNEVLNRPKDQSKTSFLLRYIESLLDSAQFPRVSIFTFNILIHDIDVSNTHVFSIP